MVGGGQDFEVTCCDKFPALYPLYPCYGYGFLAGTGSCTHTRTPEKPAALTRGFPLPVTIPKEEKHLALRERRWF